jgi:endonuclease-3
MSDPEPARNISGGAAGGGAVVAEGTDPEALPDDAPRAARIVARLGERYWRKEYGGRDAFECLVRTVLSQNTSDENSQPAYDALVARYGGETADGLAEAGDTGPTGDDDGSDLAVALANADREQLAEVIAPAGLHNQKSKTIVRLAQRIVDEYGGAAAFDAFVREEPAGTVRDALLDMRGVGPKTADCVLLFAGGRDGVFPVDTHVHRLYRRLGVAPPDADHEDVRAVLEREVPGDWCGFGHTASIQFGREVCGARAPACLDDLDACPLADICDRVGVDPDAGTAVDPAEVAE